MLLFEHPFQSCDGFYFPFTKIDGTEIRSGHGLVILFPPTEGLAKCVIVIDVGQPNAVQTELQKLLSMTNDIFQICFPTKL